MAKKKKTQQWIHSTIQIENGLEFNIKYIGQLNSFTIEMISFNPFPNL